MSLSKVENELNELLEKVELISTKRINKRFEKQIQDSQWCKIFSSGALQIFLVFISANNCIEILSRTQKYFHGSQWKFQKILKISLDQTIILLQFY